MNTNKRRARHKRWFKRRVRSQRREQFKRAWRQHFIDTGILPKD